MSRPEQGSSGTICSVHNVPTYTCPRECSAASNGSSERVEDDTRAMEHLIQSVNEIGNGYNRLQQLISESDPPGADVASVPLNQPDPTGKVNVSLTVSYARGSEPHAVSISGSQNSDDGIVVKLYVNTSGVTILKEVRAPGRRIDYVLKVQDDGIHLANPAITAWSNQRLRLEQKVLQSDRVKSHLKKNSALAEKIEDNYQFSPRELKEIWDDAHSDKTLLDRVMGAPKFPTELDPGAYPPETILETRLVQPVIDAINAVIQLEIKKAETSRK